MRTTMVRELGERSKICGWQLWDKLETRDYGGSWEDMGVTLAETPKSR